MLAGKVLTLRIGGVVPRSIAAACQPGTSCQQLQKLERRNFGVTPVNKRIGISPSIAERYSVPPMEDPAAELHERPQAWVSSFDTIKEKKVDLIDLEPESYVKALSRAEMVGGGKKPWEQTGLGRSRAGSIRAPQWKSGGVAHGIRGPRTWFYMLPDSLRIKGLCIALTIKHAQDDLVIVDSFHDLPPSLERVMTAEEVEKEKEKEKEGVVGVLADAEGDEQKTKVLKPHEILWEMAEERNWGYSVLFIDLDDQCPRNLTLACAENPSFTAMPYYGLNCYSMMYHHTLVMTRPAVEKIQGRLLFQLHRADSHHKSYRYMDFKKVLLEEGEMDPDAEDPMPPFV